MNKKGQVGVAQIILIFVAVIVGVIIFQAIAQESGKATNTISVANESLGTIDNTTVYLTNYRAISDVVIYNESGDAIVPSSNYTITNNVIHPTTGALSVQIVPAADPDTEEYYGFEWTISGTAQPLTYVADSGGRAMVALIPIFFALLVALIALYPVYESGLKEWMGR